MHHITVWTLPSSYRIPGYLSLRWSPTSCGPVMLEPHPDSKSILLNILYSAVFYFEMWIYILLTHISGSIPNRIPYMPKIGSHFENIPLKIPIFYTSLRTPTCSIFYLLFGFPKSFRLTICIVHNTRHWSPRGCTSIWTYRREFVRFPQYYG